MMTYLNGTDDCGCKTSINGKFKDFFKKEVEKAKHINDQVRELHKKIIEKNKELAKKIGAGVKRFAHVKKEVEFKAFIYALKHNVADLSVRLKMEYKTHPNEVKSLLMQFGDWNTIKDAINTGDKNHRLKEISGLGEGEDAAAGAGASGGGNAGQYAEYAKASVGIIQKIIQWFKKRKKSKQGDDQVVSDMSNSVDADSSIPKTDENGKPLPAHVDPDNKDHEGLYEKVTKGNLGKILLVGGGVFLAYKMLKK